MKAVKYRLYPNEAQRQLCEQHFGHSRHVYNWALQEKRSHYEVTGQNLSRRELQDRLVASKSTEKPWLKGVNSQSLLASLLNLDKAFGNFFAGRAKFPQFKKKYDPWQSYQCPQHVTLDLEQGFLNFPKIKHVKAVIHRALPGSIKTVTIKRSPSGKYYASVLVDDGVVNPLPDTVSKERALGIDLGICRAFVCSDGTEVENPRFLQKALARLRQQQQVLSRKQKMSKNRFKAKRKVAILYEKVSQKREAFLQEKSTELVVKSHATTLVLETLKIKNLIRNRRLSRHIADIAWGRFVSMLEYKAAWHGKNVIRVDQYFPSSKRCHLCGYLQTQLPLSIREWKCPGCQCSHDRDLNAAINIRDRGVADSLGHSDCIKSSLVA